jgi:exodeoxyribonuclease V
MTTTTTSAKTLFSYLPFEATREQALALYRLEEFLDEECGDDVFVLRGAAGTGKTSLVQAAVEYLEALEVPCYLSAPTGRASKVLGHKSRRVAHTIHSTIYRVVPTEDEKVLMERRTNDQSGYSVYIVDEASMISDRLQADGSFVTPGSLLSDLLSYIKQGNARNKIVFIGDRYQLAPVMESESVALNREYFLRKYRLTGQQAELTEVKRQVGQSPILTLAHDIRRRSDEGRALGALNVFRLSNTTSGVFKYLNLYGTDRMDRVVMIGCAHKNVYTFNQMVRERLGLSGLLAIGDQVMVNENWIGDALVVKGETGIVRAIHDAIEPRAGLKFVTATIEFRDPENQPMLVTTKVLLDTLKTPDATLPAEVLRNLIADRMAKNPKYRNNPHPANDAYVGAMRLRYGHGMTAYSAQGGEWDHVLLHPWFPENHYRYAYTAVTRARQSVTSWHSSSNWWGNKN